MSFEEIFQKIYNEKNEIFEQVKRELYKKVIGAECQNERKALYLTLSPSQDVLLQKYEKKIDEVIDAILRNSFAKGAIAGMALALSLTNTENFNQPL